MGGGNDAWAESVTYTISSKNTLTTTETAPTGSSATIVETYSTSKQMTLGNSQTLTLSGYNGYKITSITLSMKSNKSGGAGKLSYSTNGGNSYTYLIGTSSSGLSFNNSAWNGDWSTTYVSITKNVKIEPTTSNLIIKIEATANSLYCQSYTLTYEKDEAEATTTTIEGTTNLNKDVNTSTVAGTLTAKVSDASGNDIDTNVTWTSSNPNVATINTNGEVTLVAEGTTTITATYAGEEGVYKSSSKTYKLIVTDSSILTLWSEDFSSYSNNTIPSGGTYSYVCVDGGTNTQIWNEMISAGGTAPELLISNTNGSFSATISDLKNCQGNTATLQFYTNQPGIQVEVKNQNNTSISTTNSISGKIVTYTFKIPSTATKITIKFTMSNSSNARLDNISLRCKTNVIPSTEDKSDPEISYTTTAYSIALSEAFATPALNNPHDLSVSYTSSNTDVATVNASTGDVTLIGAGETIITATSQANSTYKEGHASYTLTVVEDHIFVKVTSTNDLTSGTYLIVNEDGNVAFNGGLETLDATSNTINVTVKNNFIIADESTVAATFTIDITNGTIQSKSSKYIGMSDNAEGLEQTTPGTYTNSFSFDENGNAIISASLTESTMTMGYDNASDQKRFRYFNNNGGAIQLYKLVEGKTITLNACGYATFASNKVINYADTYGYTAWQITNVSDENVITFEKIWTAVAMGTGVLLWGKAQNEVALTTAAEGTDISNTNKLVGITTPTDVNDDEYYGLSGNSFVKVNAGTVPAGKALLSSQVVNVNTDENQNVKAFTFVFKDTATGIQTVQKVSAEVAARIFDLSGRKLPQPAKGINIINRKKVVVK